MLSRIGLGSLVLTLTLAGSCKRSDEQTVAPEDDQGPGGDQFTFVSTSRNEQGSDDGRRKDAGPSFDEGIAVTSSDDAKLLAENAVESQLNPKQVWKTSPVLPSRWPAREKKVMYLFYPMAAIPNSMSYYLLFSPAYYVTVSLEDGVTNVYPIKRRRKLGTIKETRPSSLERRELEIAERSLVHYLLGASTDSGEDNFWGYLKFFHEHPKFARDIRARHPKFVQWLKGYKKRRRF